jgi:hypothetical protein
MKKPQTSIRQPLVPSCGALFQQRQEHPDAQRERHGNVEAVSHAVRGTAAGREYFRSGAALRDRNQPARAKPTCWR